jgi:hypothetical protein
MSGHNAGGQFAYHAMGKKVPFGRSPRATIEQAQRQQAKAMLLAANSGGAPSIYCQPQAGIIRLQIPFVCIPYKEVLLLVAITRTSRIPPPHHHGVAVFSLRGVVRHG